MFPRWFLIAMILASLVLAGCSGEDEHAFPRVDYNKDGKVIFEELIVVFPDLTVEEFLAADGNHDGFLDEKEYGRFLEARRNGRKPAAPAASPSEQAPTQTPPDAVIPAPPAAPASAPSAASPATPEVPAQEPLAPTAPVVAESPAAPVAVPQVAAPPAATGPTSYVVARGDSLSRIAKRFGLTQKAIMEANGLKQADKLEAGATLTIPAAGEAPVLPGAPGASQAVPAGVTALVADFFTRSAAGDVNALLDLYAESVDYYNKGKSGRDIVRQDKVTSFGRWPRRTYKPGPVAVAPAPGPDGSLRVTVPVAYTAGREGATTSGQAVFTFVLRPEGQGYRIVGERSQVAKRDAP